MVSAVVLDARILVVEDESPVRRFLVAALESAGYSVVGAESGADAFERMVAAPPELVVLDVRMPGIDGFELCRRVRSTPSLSRIPVMLLTALDRPADVVAGLEAGADDFVSKPVEAAVLRARVAALFRRVKRNPTQPPPPPAAATPTTLPDLLRARVDELAEQAHLTPREREVLGLLLLGRSTSEVATAVGITHRTARFHGANVLEKLGADSRLDLFRVLLR